MKRRKFRMRALLDLSHPDKQSPDREGLSKEAHYMSSDCYLIVEIKRAQTGTPSAVFSAISKPSELGRMKILLISFAALWICSNGFPRETDTDGLHPRNMEELHTDAVNPENDAKYWYSKATNEITRKKKISSEKKAKNIIMFMGDGMSVPTLAAARFFLAQRNNKSVSESEPLSFENFLYSGFSRTYCVDKQVADSACSATAYLGGSKGNLGTIGVTGRVERGNVKLSVDPANQVNSIAYLAQKAGKATGFVTNARVTHASPAGTYAHIADRDWECDADMNSDKIDSKMYDDIAEQLILREPGINFNVIMGGGRRNFFPKTQTGPEGKKGSRADNVNLIDQWKKNKAERKAKYSYVSNRQELLNQNGTQTYLLGLFAHSHMAYNYEKDPKQPTLEEMTVEAIKVLQKAGGQKGYFLFVEGGKIDMAHHTNQAQISLDETIEFSKAIAKAVSMTSEDDTLIVVTADHAHTMSFSGYPQRQESIFGFAGKGSDKMVYTTLSYANGPGYKTRKDLSKDNTNKVDYVFPATVPLGSETHGGDDVAVFARGPNAQMLSGSYEQSYIPHAMAYVAGIRPKY